MYIRTYKFELTFTLLQGELHTILETKHILLHRHRKPIRSVEAVLAAQSVAENLRTSEFFALCNMGVNFLK